jgi:Outer membrane protein beta-barrel domain
VARISKVLLAVAVIAAPLLKPMFAQDFDWDFDENSRLNTNLGFPVTVPVGSTSELTTLGTGVVAGAGYNFNQHHAFVGEFMWNWLYPTDASLSPLQGALQSSELNGHSNLFVLTANYRFELRGRIFGTYLIGGGGLYYRNASLTQAVTPAAGTPCTQVWQWWGFRCSSGTVVVSQTRSGFSSAVFGGNAGIGFTIHVGEPRYRLYFEGRYHYAPDENFTLRFIPITVGIRF